MKNLIKFIQAYYPWRSYKECQTYLIMHTPWPIQKDEEYIKHYIKTIVLSSWEEYVQEANENDWGINPDGKPEGSILHPVEMMISDLLAVPKPLND